MKILLVIIILFLLFVFYYVNTNSKNKTFKNLILNVSNDKKQIEIIYTGVNNVVIAEIIVDKNPPKQIKFKNYKVNIPIEGSNTKRIINEVKLKNKQNEIIGLIQFARETAQFLKKEYDFESKYGYIIIERNTFDFNLLEENSKKNEKVYIYDSEDEKEKIKEEFSKFISKIDIKENSEFLKKELLSSIVLTKYIWNNFSKTGPSNSIKSNMSIYEILQILQQKNGKLQCSGTRDLFIKLSNILSNDLKIRKVEAFRYYPVIKNIVVNGHSILEIKLNDEWVLFDPFVRVFFESKKTHSLLSAVDIQVLLQKKELDYIRPIYIETTHANRNDFEVTSKPHDSYNWNYFTHFNYLIYKELEFDSESVLRKIKFFIREKIYEK